MVHDGEHADRPGGQSIDQAERKARQREAANIRLDDRTDGRESPNELEGLLGLVQIRPGSPELCAGLCEHVLSGGSGDAPGLNLCIPPLRFRDPDRGQLGIVFETGQQSLSQPGAAFGRKA